MWLFNSIVIHETFNLNLLASIANLTIHLLIVNLLRPPAETFPMHGTSSIGTADAAKWIENVTFMIFICIKMQSIDSPPSAAPRSSSDSLRRELVTPPHASRKVVQVFRWSQKLWIRQEKNCELQTCCAMMAYYFAICWLEISIEMDLQGESSVGEQMKETKNLTSILSVIKLLEKI